MFHKSLRRLNRKMELSWEKYGDEKFDAVGNSLKN